MYTLEECTDVNVREYLRTLFFKYLCIDVYLLKYSFHTPTGGKYTRKYTRKCKSIHESIHELSEIEVKN